MTLSGAADIVSANHYRDQPADGTARFFQDLCNWQRIDPFKDFVFSSPAAELASKLMGSSTGRFFHDHVLVKEPILVGHAAGLAN